MIFIFFRWSRVDVLAGPSQVSRQSGRYAQRDGGSEERFVSEEGCGDVFCYEVQASSLRSSWYTALSQSTAITKTAREMLKRIYILFFMYKIKCRLDELWFSCNDVRAVWQKSGESQETKKTNSVSHFFIAPALHCSGQFDLSEIFVKLLLDWLGGTNLLQVTGSTSVLAVEHLIVTRRIF